VSEVNGRQECPKCRCNIFDTGEIRASGGALSAMFDLQNRRFSYVTCKRCRYTEFYQTELSSLQKALDLFVG
jgi:hypothetical protein